ncbi:hypothetical protein [Streptomyces sp. NPDC005009]
MPAGSNELWAPFRPLTGRGRPKRLGPPFRLPHRSVEPVTDAYVPTGRAGAREREVPPDRVVTT